MKRIIPIVLSLLFLTLPLFAGGQPEEEGPISITFWTHEDPNRTILEERYIQEFESSHPNVTIERVTNSSKKMPELLLTAFAASEGSHIFNTQIEDGYAYIVNGRVAPVDPKSVGYASALGLSAEPMVSRVCIIPSSRLKVYTIWLKLST